MLSRNRSELEVSETVSANGPVRAPNPFRCSHPGVNKQHFSRISERRFPPFFTGPHFSRWPYELREVHQSQPCDMFVCIFLQYCTVRYV